ncbi:uncharacterized protein [Typha latifolia]|uniref:uncharacterized protein n=1 Tax=Typha latifolia TaxID=4733 RepID=UPI003C300ECB
MEEYASYNEFQWRFVKELRDSHQKVPFISPSPTSASHFLPKNCNPYYITRSPSQVLLGSYDPFDTSDCKMVDDVNSKAQKEEEEEVNLWVQSEVIDEGSHSYGKVKEESQPLDPMEVEVLQREDWLQYPLADAKQETNPIVSQRYTENQHLKDPLVSVATVTPDAKTTCWSDHIANRKSIKKKKKRMIKNRESAARSRAKKQAYVKRLEQMVLELRTLKTQLMKRNELESSLHFSPSVEPKYKLRRISSSLF